MSVQVCVHLAVLDCKFKHVFIESKGNELLTSTINSGVQGEDSGHFSAFGFWESINSCLITVVHTILFNVNEGWSSGEVDDKISLFSDGAGPFVEELFIDWGVFLVQIHLEVEWVVKSDVVFEFVSESGYVGDVVDQFHKVGLLIGGQGWVDSHELHWVVECNVSVIQKVVSEEISVDDDVLSENDLITDTQHCGST